NNGTAIVVTFFLKDGYEQAVVTDGFDQLLATLADAHHEFHLMGEPPLNERIRRGIERNTSLIPIAFVLAFVLAGALLKSIRKRGLILVGIATLFTVIWTVGTSVLLGIPQSVFISAAPVVIMALADDAIVQLMSSYRGNIAVVIASNGRTIWFTVATTIVSFGTLITFGIASIENFGVTIAFGGFYSFWMAMLWNGALLKVFKSLGELPTTHGWWSRQNAMIDQMVTRLLQSVTGAVLRHPKRIVLINTVIVLAGIIVIPFTLTVGDNPMKLAPHDDPMRLAEQPFSEHGGFKAEELVVAVGNNLDPVVLDLIAEAQMGFEELSGTYTQSGADVASYCNYLHEAGAPGSFRRPETRRAIENQLRLYVAPRDRQKYFRGTTLLRVVVMVNTLDQREQMHLHAAFDKCLTAIVQTRLATATPEERSALGDIRWWWGGNSVVFWITMTEYVAIGKILNIATAIPLIFILCWWHFGSWRLALLALVPLTSATIATFAIMGLLGMRLDLTKSVIVGVATGIGADYAVHFIDRFREERRNGYSVEVALSIAITETGKAILTDSSSTSLGFLVLLGSTFTPLRDMGILIALNMQGCAWETILTMAAIISLWRALFGRLCPVEKRS
ncbi:MAG: MMPL family transporter, partial [Bacteroidota bacterium]